VIAIRESVQYTPFPETGHDDGLVIEKLQPDFSPVTAHSARIGRSKRAPAGERTFEGKAAESLEYETLIP
jgi:hypothetical protein